MAFYISGPKILFETTEISTHPNSTQQESNYWPPRNNWNIIESRRWIPKTNEWGKKHKKCALPANVLLLVAGSRTSFSAVLSVLLPSSSMQKRVLLPSSWYFYYVQWVRGYCSFGGIVDHHYLNKNVDITTCFLNNLHQVRSKPR
jgi:hypothetical protein